MRRLTIAVILTLALDARADEEPRPAATQAELEALRERATTLERRFEEEARRRPAVSLGHDGFVLATADGGSQLHVRLLVQLDGRGFYGDGPPVANTFLLRRARPYLEGTVLDRVDFRIVPDFGQGQALVQDAHVDVRVAPWLRLRAGKFKTPFGLERIQLDANLKLPERSLASDLTPDRDLGVAAVGDVAGVVSYAIAAVNGAPDGANAPDADPSSDKDFVGRILVKPLAPARVGIGVAATLGDQSGTTAATNLPVLRTVGQQTFFNYLGATASDGAVLPAGMRWRLAPQAYAYLGPFGLLTEYIRSVQAVQRGADAATLANDAWDVTASVVLTGEDATDDAVVPRHSFNLDTGDLGSIELTVRYAELRVDDGAFPRFADPAASARRARELGVGAGWTLNPFVRVSLYGERTSFEGGAAAGDRPTELVVLARMQLSL